MLTLYNTRTRQVEPVKPLVPHAVKIYTCGPTVYRDAHIGNLRSYLMADWVRRTLELHDVNVIHVKNITDVGHMRQEILDQGEDKVIAAAIAEGKTPAQIAQFYTNRFLVDEKKLNILPAHKFPKATDHVPEMLEIIENLLENNYAYQVEGNVYFDVSSFPSYGQLSGNTDAEQLIDAVRVTTDPLKDDTRDFTLWKRAETGRELVWPSPWGDGFPGWHIECSAMSMKYLGDRFDIHTGGVDNIFPHHEGEIAQSGAYTGHRVVPYWIHGQHLLADGVKMSKSAGNSFILSDIEEHGIDPLSFRYLCMTVRYRTRLNFTFTSIKAAQRALLRLRIKLWEWSLYPPSEHVDYEIIEKWRSRFVERLDDDLDMPRALALIWDLVRADNLSNQSKLNLVRSFDKVLGLDLDRMIEKSHIPIEVLQVASKRDASRKEGTYSCADELRSTIVSRGFVIEDTSAGSRIRPVSSWELRQEEWPTISSSTDVVSVIERPDKVDTTIGIIASNYMEDTKRCLTSALEWTGNRTVEAIVVDNHSTDGTGIWLDKIAKTDPRLRILHTDHVIGEAAAKNLVLKQSTGRTIILIDTSIEVSGDIYRPVDEMLCAKDVGLVGPFGVRSMDMQHFHEGEEESGDVDAIQAYCFAFRRERLKEVGLMRESFRFYRNLDLDYSFHFKNLGWRIVAKSDLPVQRHLHRVWSNLPERERDEMSKKNFGRFLHKWGTRKDLLVCNQ